MNKLSLDILEYITIFLDNKDIHSFIGTNKIINEIKYNLLCIPYNYAIKYQNKDKIRKIKNCDDVSKLYKFPRLITLKFKNDFNNNLQPLKKWHFSTTIENIRVWV